ERNEEVERQIAEYEKKLREQLLREHEFAELAAAQHEQAATKRFLPVIAPGAGEAVARHGTCGGGAWQMCSSAGKGLCGPVLFQPKSKAGSPCLDRRTRSLCRHFLSRSVSTAALVPSGLHSFSLSFLATNFQSQFFRSTLNFSPTSHGPA